MSGEDNLLKLVDADDEAGSYRLQDQIGFALRKAHQRHIGIFAKHIGDLTPPQFAALAKLYEEGPASQNQLGSRVAMDAATVKGVIDRLRARELVALAPDGEDRRRLVVSLTPQGADMVQKLVPAARRATAETIEGLSEKEVATLMKLLTRIT